MILATMRAMCWERAKAELMSMLHTYHEDPNFEEIDEKVEKFITEIEGML